MRFRSAALGRRRKAVFGIAITLALTLSGIPSHAASSNDDFATAFVVTETPFSDVTSNADATTETGEPQTSCSTATGTTVWYAYAPVETLRIDASTFGSKFDTVLAAYTGSSLEDLTEVACNDDATDVGSRQSRLRVVARPGETLFLQIGGYQGETGALSLSLTASPAAANDDFASAIEIDSLPFETSIDLSNTTLEDGEPTECDMSEEDSSVWFRFVPSESVGVKFAYEEDESPIVAIYAGDSLPELTPVTCDYPSRTRGAFRADTGTTYYVQVRSPWEGFSTTDLLLEEVAVPTNDDFADAIEIDAIPADIDASTWTTTLQEDEPDGCGEYLWASVWYRYTAKDATPLLASVRSQDFWPALAVYQGSALDNLSLVACGRDEPGTGDGFIPTPGETYYLQAGVHWWGFGDMTVRLRPGAGVRDPGLTYSSASTDADNPDDWSAGVWVDALVAGAGAGTESDPQYGASAEACVGIAFFVWECVGPGRGYYGR
ncbi:MAG: hypothetical protein WDA27_05155 [Actinomycetota bacterium]